MPRVQQLRSYTVPRYPRGSYVDPRPPRFQPVAKATGALALIAGLLQGCEIIPGTGVTGPPPVMPDLMTEADARQVIESVFLRNGIDLEADVPLTFTVETGDSTVEHEFIVDGYSADLRTGFEYFGEGDGERYLAGALADTSQHGPIQVEEYIEEGWEDLLEERTQAFIDSLRAMGWI